MLLFLLLLLLLLLHGNVENSYNSIYTVQCWWWWQHSTETHTLCNSQTNPFVQKRTTKKNKQTNKPALCIHMHAFIVSSSSSSTHFVWIMHLGYIYITFALHIQNTRIFCEFFSQFGKTLEAFRTITHYAHNAHIHTVSLRKMLNLFFIHHEITAVCVCVCVRFGIGEIFENFRFMVWFFVIFSFLSYF